MIFNLAWACGIWITGLLNYYSDWGGDDGAIGYAGLKDVFARFGWPAGDIGVVDQLKRLAINVP